MSSSSGGRARPTWPETCSGQVAQYLERMAKLTIASVDVVVAGVGLRLRSNDVPAGELTGATLETVPAVCQSCVWWQSRGNREPEKKVGRASRGGMRAWGRSTATTTAAFSVRCSMAAQLFPRAADLPAGPPSDDAVLVTCAYLLSDSQPWVEQSSFSLPRSASRVTKARTRSRGVRVPPLSRRASATDQVPCPSHGVPRDFLADPGFRRFVRPGGSSLRVSRSKLQPVEEGAREVLQVVQRRSSPLRRQRLGQRLAVYAAERLSRRASSAIWIAFSAPHLYGGCRRRRRAPARSPR